MKILDIFENNERQLENEILDWLMSKRIPKEDARKYLEYHGIEKLGKELDAEKAEAKEKMDRLQGGLARNSRFQRAKHENPDRVAYKMIDKNTKIVMIDNEKVGTLSKDENKWAGIIHYNNKQYKIEPKSIMKVQDEIDRIAFGMK